MNDLHIALIQTGLHWQDVQANLQMLDKKISAISERVSLIVLPEAFSTGFSMEAEKIAEGMDGAAMQWLKKIAAEKNCTVTGSLMLHDEQEGRKKYFNRLIWMKPDGACEYYDKKHLFSLSHEHKVFTAGDKRLIVSIDGWKICPMICYDLRFPVWSRNAIDSERIATYDMLVYVANWPERRAQAWKALLQARAIENQCYVVGVNRTGHDADGIYHSGASSAIGPLGDILYREEDKEDVAIVHLNYEELIKTRRQLPFLKDADAFELK